MSKKNMIISSYMHFPGSLILSRKHLLMASTNGKDSGFKMDFGLADVTKKRSTSKNPCEKWE